MPKKLTETHSLLFLEHTNGLTDPECAFLERRRILVLRAPANTKTHLIQGTPTDPPVLLLEQTDGINQADVKRLQAAGVSVFFLPVGTKSYCWALQRQPSAAKA